MSRIIRGQIITLSALLAALVVTLAACGGGSSSGGGGSGGSGSTIAGTVSDGVASVYPTGEEQPVLVALADMLVEPAHAAGIPNVPVQLYDAAGTTLIASTTTDAGGHFMFTGLNPGTTYTVSVLGQTTQVTTGNNDKVELQADNNGTMVFIEVESDDTRISGEVEDDAKSDDDASSGDDDSSADGASDGDSTDDVSADDQSEDDQSSDGQSDDESEAA